MKHRYLYLLAAPAMAGLLFAAGCDTEDEVDTAGTGTDTTGTDSARPAGGMESPPAGDTAGATVSDAQIQQITQLIDQARQTAESYGERIEANAEIEGWGTGETARRMLDQTTENFDAIKSAVSEREWTGVATTMRDLMARPMPADLKQQVQAIADQLKTLNIPAFQNLGSMLGGEGELPTVPGMPAPGETTPPTTRPGGGA